MVVCIILQAVLARLFGVQPVGGAKAWSEDSSDFFHSLCDGCRMKVLVKQGSSCPPEQLFGREEACLSVALTMIETGEDVASLMIAAGKADPDTPTSSGHMASLSGICSMLYSPTPSTPLILTSPNMDKSFTGLLPSLTPPTPIAFTSVAKVLPVPSQSSLQSPGRSADTPTSSEAHAIATTAAIISPTPSILNYTTSSANRNSAWSVEVTTSLTSSESSSSLSLVGHLRPESHSSMMSGGGAASEKTKLRSMGRAVENSRPRSVGRAACEHPRPRSVGRAASEHPRPRSVGRADSEHPRPRSVGRTASYQTRPRSIGRAAASVAQSSSDELYARDSVSHKPNYKRMSGRGSGQSSDSESPRDNTFPPPGFLKIKTQPSAVPHLSAKPTGTPGKPTGTPGKPTSTPGKPSMALCDELPSTSVHTVTYHSTLIHKSPASPPTFTSCLIQAPPKSSDSPGVILRLCPELPPAYFPVNVRENFQCRVVFVESMERFYIHVEGVEEGGVMPLLAVLQAMLEEDCPLVAVLPGQLAMAQYDGSWHRVVVRSPGSAPRHHLVLYVDYGNMDEVAVLKAMPRPLATHPPLALSCRLQQNSQTLSLEDFCQMVAGRVLTAELEVCDKLNFQVM